MSIRWRPASSNSSQQLPEGPLAPGASVLLSSDGMATCGAAVAGRLSVNLGDSGGFLQISKSSMEHNTVVQTVGDAVSWSSGSAGIIPGVPSSSKGPNAVWYRYKQPATDGSTASYGWQRADLSESDYCSYAVTVSAPDAGTQTMGVSGLVQSDDVPPVTIASVDGSASAASPTAVMPAADVGLKAPIINELLPNPASPATDADSEFIELYNPNGAAFDLSGFMLQAASSSSASAKTYTFPAGTHLAPKSFTAFMSKQTNLGMSNSGGQVWLLDPFAKAISQSAAYGTAKDGQVWALANGSWLWSTTSTPNKANIIKAPLSAAAKKAAKKKASVPKRSATAVKGASTSAAAGPANATGSPEPVSQGRVHVLILAAIAVLADDTGRMSTVATYQINSESSESTEQLGEHIGARLRGGEVIALTSDLGGGKTTFVRGLARGIGSTDHVASPTFTISREYRAPNYTLYHFDFYRLQEAGIMSHELAELSGDPHAVVAVEWGDIVEGVLPEERLVVELTRAGESDRVLKFTCPPGLAYLLPDGAERTDA